MRSHSETSKGSILVVDDTPVNLNVLSHMLTQHGYQVQTAKNGKVALQAVQQAPPDIILLDVMMPEMNGYETCRHLKADGITQEIPVIFITFLKELDEKLKGFEVGGIDYITKPFQRQEVLARVETHIANRRFQQQLQEERTRFQILANATFEGILIHDLHEIVEGNRAIVEISGYQRSVLIGNSPLVFIAPDWHERTMQQLHRADGQPQLVEGRHYNGRGLSLEIRVNPISWQEKPMLVSAVRDISQQMTLEHENLTLRTTLNTREKFGEMVGKSPVMRKVYEQITQAALSDETVMIYGETGTGKELAARTIFSLSQEHTKEFIPVNCGAIQESLFESQFFGYRKGAFTGADRDTPGFFDRAQGGTLFLDEVGELTPAMQIKLLRVLEDRTYLPVGTTTSRTADVRIIAATNQELRSLRQTGHIRDDFFHRLHVIALELPPLRHHKEDIPLLIKHFLEHSQSGKPHTIPPQIVERFCAYDWPGNVRELFNELRRYLATGEIELDASSLTLIESSSQLVVDAGERPFHEIIEEIEKQLISQALAQNAGNKVKAAEKLQLPLRTLHRKISKYHLR